MSLLRVTILLVIPVIVPAQDMLTHGQDVFNQSCATGYCHGLKGAAAGAPRLAARGFDQDHLTQVIRSGIPGTAMPAFGLVLKRADLFSVIAYVGSLNGIAPRNPGLDRGPQPRPLSKDAARGRALFYDAVRGFGRCSVCHLVDGMGIAVADPIAKIPESAAAVRALASPHVWTATADSESFPVVVVSKGGAQTKVFDLTKPPPVERSFPAAAVTLRETSTWRHAEAVSSYSDAELEYVLAFLRETAL
jgi:mono/diheme cytochrome c family protein